MARPPNIPPKRKIKLKIPHLTPKQTRLVLLKEEEKKKKQELAVLRQQLEPARKSAQKKAAAARKLEQVISGNRTNIRKDSNIVTDEELESLPAQVKDDILEEDVNIVFKPNPGPQTEFLAATEKEVLFGGARGGGKQLDIDTFIPTPTGYSTIKELKIGDFVLSPRGEPVKVLWKSDIDYTPMVYKVEFNTGESFLADANHLWFTLTSKERKAATKLTDEYRLKRRENRPSRSILTPTNIGAQKSVTQLNRNRVYNYKIASTGTIKTTEEIYKTLYDGKEINHSIECSNPIEYPPQELEIPPYLLGLWLGDGYSAKGTIGMSEKDMKEVQKYLIWPIKSEKVHLENRNTPFKTVTFLNLTKILSDLSLKNNKHIPLKYLRSSIQDRQELLQGIMDTDGHCDKRGQLELTFKSKKLMEDVIDLLSGLGIKAVLKTKHVTSSEKDYGIYFRIKFCSKFSCFKLTRKIERQKLTGHRPTVFRRFITNVCPADSIPPMQCIQVDHSDGLYLIGKTYITTHNSFSLIVDPLRYCDRENHRALLLRKTMPELRDMIAHAHRLYKAAFPEVKWKEQEKVFTFPSGARIEFGYAENEQDAMRYQGQAYTWIGVDEIGLYASDRIITLLKGSLRSVDTSIPTFMRFSCNPGGPGMSWLKEQFVDAAPWNETFYVPIEQPDGTTDYITRKFIPSKLSDNPYLNQTPEYRNMLLSLPEKLRKMWLEGRWDIIEGAAFEEFDPAVHVVEPFEIPSNWPRFRACDWGFSTPFCVLWIAIDYENTAWVYREFYGKGLTADIFAQRVRAMELGEYVQYGVIDSSTYSRRGDVGPPVPETMRLNGCVWRPSDRSGGSRHSGKAEVHRRLRIIQDENGIATAKLKIFKSCRNLIRTLPALPLDKNDMEDIDTTAEDHCYDALRYGLMSRPLDPVRLDYFQQIQRNEGWSPANRRVGY